MFFSGGMKVGPKMRRKEMENDGREFLSPDNASHFPCDFVECGVRGVRRCVRATLRMGERM